MNLTIAKELAQLSMLAYSNPNVVINDNAALIQQTHFGQVIAFRGTQTAFTELSAIDWLNDADIVLRKTDYTKGLVHSGFWQSVEDLWKHLTIDPHQLVYVTGHSKGGALATLAAKRFESQGVKSIVYTFGSPKTGNQEFADAYNLTHYRLEHCNDIVPHLLIEKYKSVGELHFLDWHNNLRLNSQWLTAKRGVKLFFAGSSLFTDHLIKNYVVTLSNVKPNKKGC